jgi:hypothetical protein
MLPVGREAAGSPRRPLVLNGTTGASRADFSRRSDDGSRCSRLRRVLRAAVRAPAVLAAGAGGTLAWVGRAHGTMTLIASAIVVAAWTRPARERYLNGDGRERAARNSTAILSPYGNHRRPGGDRRISAAGTRARDRRAMHDLYRYSRIGRSLVRSSRVAVNRGGGMNRPRYWHTR